MAKLSAHGYEIARVIAETDTEKCEYSYRSDGHIMRKYRFAHDSFRYNRVKGWSNGAWKLWKRFRDRNITADRIRASAGHQADRLRARGIRVTVK